MNMLKKGMIGIVILSIVIVVGLGVGGYFMFSEKDITDYCEKNECERFLPNPILTGALPLEVCTVTDIGGDPRENGFVNGGCSFIGVDCQSYQEEFNEINRGKFDLSGTSCNTDAHYYMELSHNRSSVTVGEMEDMLDYLHTDLEWPRENLEEEYLEILNKLDNYPKGLSVKFLIDASI